MARARKRRRGTSHSLWLKSAIFIVAAVVRLIAATQIADLPLTRTPHYDSLEYLSWARQLAAGDFSWPAPPRPDRAAIGIASSLMRHGTVR